MAIGEPQHRFDHRPILESIEQAQYALTADKLGTVYIRADTVFIVTSYGSGTFDRQAWERATGSGTKSATPKR